MDMVKGVKEIKKLMDEAVLSCGKEFEFQMREELVSLAERKFVPEFLQRTLNDPEELSLIASRSYAHYNNFDKIVLISSESPRYTLRLHVWWQNNCRIVQENIHDHRWAFSSVILKGEYDYEIYQPSPMSAGIEMYEYHYFTRRGLNQYAMPFVRKANVERVSKDKMREGNCYTMPEDVLHRITCNAETVTASLMILGEPRKDYARVFAREPNQAGKNINSDAFSTVEISEKFRNLLKYL